MPSRARWACRSVLGICLPLALVLCFAPRAPVAASDELPAAPGTVPVNGATIIGQRWLTQRTIELVVSTPSFTEPTRVEVMLPASYTADSSRKWPVTYYLNGTNGDQTLFRTVYHGEAQTASYPSIVVAPAGHAGYWSDWYNEGAGGPPEYETFVSRQLIPLIDANFRTMPDRAQRAILGESMGGYGVMMMAARHPDLFVAASSLSGAVDTNWIPGTVVLSASPILDLSLPESIYGPRATQEVRWRGHNPADLARNLGSLDLQLYTGNGVLGAPEAGDAMAPAGCALESAIVLPENQSLRDKLIDLGIPHFFRAYDWGCHSPALIQQEIAETLPRFTNSFAADELPPAAFDYRSTEPQFSVFGWSATADPSRALEFLDMTKVSASGFTITGSGTTRVTTPPLFRGAAAVTVLVDDVARSVRPDATGRLTLTVDLGPANRDQQYMPGAANIRTTSVVRIVHR